MKPSMFISLVGHSAALPGRGSDLDGAVWTSTVAHPCRHKRGTIPDPTPISQLHTRSAILSTLRTQGTVPQSAKLRVAGSAKCEVRLPARRALISQLCAASVDFPHRQPSPYPSSRLYPKEADPFRGVSSSTVKLLLSASACGA